MDFNTHSLGEHAICLRLDFVQLNYDRTRKLTGQKDPKIKIESKKKN
jgi:hypothetical protein